MDFLNLSFVPPLRLGRALGLSLVAVALAGAPAVSSMAQAQRADAPVVSGLPSLGDGSDMSIAEERQLGDQIAQQIYGDPDYLDDPVLRDYLQAIWSPLLSAARARGDVSPELGDRFAWELMISRDKSVNAFALPGGYLGVHLGLLAVTERPEQLASVLAHELSHVSQRHIARMIASEKRKAPWLLGALILSALAARNNAEVANAAIVGTQAVAAQTQLNFSRAMEQEADRVGFGVLSQAGFDPQGFVEMFSKLQQAGRLNDDGSFPYLRSHPLNSQRIADMQARLPGGVDARARGQGPLRAAPLVPGVELHLLMSARARVLAESVPDRQRAWLHSGQRAGASNGDLYAATLSALRLGERALALQLAQRLRAGVSAEAGWAAEALELEVLLSPVRGTPAAASEPAQMAGLRDKALANGSRAGLLLGAQAALAGGAPRVAEGALLAWVVEHPRDPLAWQTLARVHQSQGQTLRAVRAEAESRVALLDYAGAVDRFKAAQRLPVSLRAADPIELAIVDSRRREVEVLMRERAKEE